MDNTIREYALYLASIGIPVFPVMPHEKRPYPGTQGVKDATTDQEQIKRWFDSKPQMNYGVACGNGLVVVDIDMGKNKDGHAALAELGTMPPTVIVNTPTGGRHYYLRTDDMPPNRNGLRPGIDIRGSNYYVVGPASVHPNGGRYTFKVGSEPWTLAMADYPSFLRISPERSGDEVHSTVTDTHCTPSRQSASLILQRASAYADSIPPAIDSAHGGPGDGHERLLWFFDCMVNGWELPDSEVRELALRFNDRCTEPWDLSDPKWYRDFWRKMDQAKSNPPNKFPRGWLKNDPEYNPPTIECDFDIAAFAKEMKNEERKDVRKLIREQQEDAAQRPSLTNEFWRNVTSMPEPKTELEYLCQPYGLIGDIVAYINSQTPYHQPFLAVAAALSFCGAIMGQKIADESDNRTNLYTFGIGPSSCGKGGALNAIRKVAEEAGALDYIGGEDVTSPAAIETALDQQASMLFLWDEVGFLLKSTKGSNEHKAGVIPFLMRLYSLAAQVYKGKVYADPEKTKMIVQPCVSFYATSTPERIKEGISVEELEDGWMARTLMFMADNDPKYQKIKRDQPNENLVQRVRYWSAMDPPRMDRPEYVAQFANVPAQAGVKAKPNPYIYTATNEADSRFEELRKYCRSMPESAPYRTLWQKSEELARRIALIMAAGDHSEQSIELRDAEYGCRVVMYTMASFCDQIAPEVGCERDLKNYYRTLSIVVSAGPDGIQHSKLTNRCTRWRKDFKGIIASLVEAEKIVVIKPNGGAMWYFDFKYKDKINARAVKHNPPANPKSPPS